MSSSDSDNSIDWLASDEDDYDSPKRLSPQQAEESPQPSSSSLSPSLSSSSSSSSSTSLSPSSSSSSSPSSSSSSSSVRESPTSRRRKRSGCCDCKDGGRCGGDADSAGAAQTSPVSPVQGFTSVCEQLPVESKRHSERKRLCEKTPADTEHELLSQKCAELQCYIPPLSSILRGLRSGRYSERLSSFQESVAMDRIQRIMGVLQNPHLSGHFLSIIMKIEEMLHSWFPHVRPNLTQTDERAPAKKQKQRHAGASPPPASPLSLCSSDSSTRLKWLHTSPICSLKTPQSTLSQPAVSASPPPPRCGQDITQDSAVSSSTDPRCVPGRRLPVEPRLSRGPPPFKIRSPCLERLLQAKDSIIAPRTDGGWLS